jgi:NAD(P)H-hydrate epimerase
MRTIPNTPDLWRGDLPWPPKPDAHKYARGHAVMAGGAVMTGAIRMASRAAMRIGAGLCTVAAPKDLMAVYTEDAPHILFAPLERMADFGTLLEDPRKNAILIGPGMGRDDPETLRRAILDALRVNRATVLDADALTVFGGRADELFKSLHGQCVITPHEGEFKTLFGEGQGGRIERVMDAVDKCGCTVLLKGAETVIGAPGEMPVVNTHATPWLATAGAGDVLAGMIAGLMAQGMAPFGAACAAAWLHGEAGLRCGPGLVAPDLIASLPAVMQEFS